MKFLSCKQAHWSWRAIAVVAVLTMGAAAESSALAAESVIFPWGCPSAQALPNPNAPAYQTLTPAAKPRSTQVPIQQLPQKSGYAYGWFGSNPASAWGRHFGHSQNFTQWSRR